MRTLLTLALTSLLAGCTALLPHSQSEVASFESFEQARAVIEALVPMHSTAEDLRAHGLDPMRHPGTGLLTHADIARHFAPSDLVRREDIDPGVLACLSARAACRGWEISAERIHRARVGNFWADFINFSRRTEITGWRFNALVLLIDDRVVYRSWGGQPAIRQIETQHNPLGPLQDIGPALVSPH